MKSFLDELPPNQSEGNIDTLIKGFDVLTTAYERQEDGKILEILQFNVLPAYKKWRSELEKQL